MIKNPLSIKEIKVEKLFGYYSYTIPLEKSTDISQLLIIYGDNGSGKTTLLKLIFWLLSSRDKSGYKTKIAGTKFKSFSILFENGIKIGAVREGSNFIGGYTYSIEDSNKQIYSLKLKTTTKNSISLQDGSIKKAKTKEELIKEIEIIEEKGTPYVKLGLIESFDSKTIKNTINQSKTPARLRSLRAILAPYIESINAKLQALEKLKDVIYLFLNSTNQYFTNKEIDFNLSTGFSLVQKGGEAIDFSLLSSGEKQLLLLFINTITAADVATIFIIDEPEISLNIKWQRNLIDTLLKFSSSKNIQYILSTHSLELLATNLDNVTKLDEINGNA